VGSVEQQAAAGGGPGSSTYGVTTEDRISCDYVFGLVLPLKPAPLPEPERIEVPVAPAFGPYRRFFPREAVRHPAKANLHLIERLIELVSSPGYLILDPFGDLLNMRGLRSDGPGGRRHRDRAGVLGLGSRGL
jgi:hypothetical protein